VTLGAGGGVGVLVRGGLLCDGDEDVDDRGADDAADDDGVDDAVLDERAGGVAPSGGR
jgi:hypothetical protein